MVNRISHSNSIKHILRTHHSEKITNHKLDELKNQNHLKSETEPKVSFATILQKAQARRHIIKPAYEISLSNSAQNYLQGNVINDDILSYSKDLKLFSMSL